MARIVLTTYGSSGDLHPMIAVGLGLQARGHDVRVAVEGLHRATVEATGLAVYSLPGDTTALPAADTRTLLTAATPAHFLRHVLRERLLPLLPATVDALRVACADADVLVSSVLQLGAPIVADLLGIRWASIAFSPLSVPSRFIAPAPVSLPLPGRLQPLVNRAAWFVGAAVFREIGDTHINAVRGAYGLAPRHDLLLTGATSRTLTAVATSPAFVPAPPDWPASARMTGFLFWDTPDGWREPTEMTAFLAEPTPVVAVSSNSMGPFAGDVFAPIYATSVAAIRRVGARAVVVGTAPGNLPTPLPFDVYALPYAPFSTLYPRCAAVIHHGGIGTTAQALRAGVPALVLPWGVDQSFDGAQVARLSAGEWLPRRPQDERPGDGPDEPRLPGPIGQCRSASFSAIYVLVWNGRRSGPRWAKSGSI